MVLTGKKVALEIMLRLLAADNVKKVSGAFTFIEMLVVLVVIGIMATIIFPWLFKRKPETEWPAALDQFNGLVSFAKHEAVARQKVHRLLFKSNKNEPDFIVVESEERDEEKPDKKVYKQVISEYIDTKYVLPAQIKMHYFYQDSREDEFNKNKQEAYCYIIPNGLVQNCIIHITRDIDDIEEQATFKMQPFFGTFEHHEGFLKPSKPIVIG